MIGAAGIGSWSFWGEKTPSAFNRDILKLVSSWPKIQTIDHQQRHKTPYNTPKRAGEVSGDRWAVSEDTHAFNSLLAIPILVLCVCDWEQWDVNEGRETKPTGLRKPTKVNWSAIYGYENYNPILTWSFLVTKWLLTDCSTLLKASLHNQLSVSDVFYCRLIVTVGS